MTVETANELLEGEDTIDIAAALVVPASCRQCNSAACRVGIGTGVLFWVLMLALTTSI